MPPDIADNGKIVTLEWPRCLEAHRVTSIKLGKQPVFIGRTTLGIESRQMISRVPRGVSIDVDFRWVSDTEDDLGDFYKFWYTEAFGDYNVFRIDRSNIPCLIPGWNEFKKYMPSQLWRMSVGGDSDGLGGLTVTPSNCCSIDFSVTLLNILLPANDYQGNVVDQAALLANLDDPVATTPKIN